jgi:RNA polymerase sigma-70 factor, ECF subfamily
MQLNEKNIIEKIIKKDKNAFEEFYKIYSKRIFYFAQKLLYNKESAEEIVQEVFIKIWDKMYTFRLESSLSAWIYRITFNTVENYKKAKKNRLVIDEFEENSSYRMSCDDKIEIKLDLDKAIRNLPDKAKAIVILHDIEGYTHEEISEIVGITTGASKSHLHRARFLLRKELGYDM